MQNKQPILQIHPPSTEEVSKKKKRLKKTPPQNRRLYQGHNIALGFWTSKGEKQSPRSEEE